MTISASESKEDRYAAELYPSIGAVAATYGDADGKYVEFLKQAEPEYADEAWFLWNQPLAGGVIEPNTGAATTNDNKTSTGKTNTQDNAALSSKSSTWSFMLMGAVMALGLHAIF